MGETTTKTNPSQTAHGTTSVVRRGISFSRYFAKPRVSPYDEEVEWELRTASIANEKGQTIFEQKNVEVPKGWSQTATNIVASKYLHGKIGTLERESSVRQLVSRVVDSIADWGIAQGYFATRDDGENFRSELAHLMLTQKASFNSPVWFNCGVERCEPDAHIKNWHWLEAEQKVVIEDTGYRNPQCSACFINSVQDSLESILNLAKTEGMLFKWGSGSGTNLSTLRSANESIVGGGKASGPVSFMRGYDAFAGVIKSGGKTRRAAKMVILNIDHPDVVEFIECKAKEERKAWTLVEAGYDPSLDGEAYSSIFFQNANNSVRVTDDFMRAVEDDREWSTREVTSGKVVDTFRARDLMRRIAEAAHQCGDPGMQFDTTVNRWHTCKETGRINASNPCSEYMFLDDTACNLSSINLMKFLSPAGHFDAEAFRHAVDTMIVAQEIIVDNASYPTEKIAFNSHNYRPLGLGYANLGALLMACGLPYDSDAGRDFAGAVTALMHGQAYLTSARIAAAVGPFPHYEQNRQPMLDVIAMHRAALDQINPRYLPAAALPSAAQSVPFVVSGAEPPSESNLYTVAHQVWKECYEQGVRYGYRNSQVTVLAPTGTIGFMMDCDTTGVEPDLALVKFKKLVGGGLIKVVNNTVPDALLRMGYPPNQVDAIVDYVDRTGTIEGAPHLKPEHLPVFDCSLRPANGNRSIHPMGHIRMMAAAQPFISGAISKTVNMPEDTTVEEIMETYLESWKLGLKAVAIYRDGSKRVQPLSAGSDKDLSRAREQAATQARESQSRDREGAVAVSPASEPRALASGQPGTTRQGTASAVPSATPSTAALAAEGTSSPHKETRKPGRRKLPDTRDAITHKFSIGGHEGYITVGMYPDGQPGEIFIVMAKEGSTVSGLMDSFATAISLALQYGVPLKVLVDKFSHTRFAPSGWTGHKDIGYANSIMDYIFRWLALKFLPGYQSKESTSMAETPGPEPASSPSSPTTSTSSFTVKLTAAPLDAPSCPDCGSIMTRNGSCYKCENCGATSGCS
ncbi:MAG: ribonucleoside-diphosphate reductase, adenosylcobalamin-dependent [Acidobacteria bacterium RIFCSPLOWO2_12_FULL_60_22]|nr:MAG: ribonucleoside-diphosphate reductase, adenosylcobalamin-dependent [Acidobacteria bacterium RIFCSPLOWO2_12_FULL_60_22]